LSPHSVPTSEPSKKLNLIYDLSDRKKIPQKWDFEDDFPFPQVGYVSSLEGIIHVIPLIVFEHKII